MKLTKSGFIVSIILILVVLGLLRYKPWSSNSSTNVRDVVHEGPNNKAQRELTVGYLPVTCHR